MSGCLEGQTMTMRDLGYSGNFIKSWRTFDLNICSVLLIQTILFPVMLRYVVLKWTSYSAVFFHHKFHSRKLQYLLHLALWLHSGTVGCIIRHSCFGTGRQGTASSGPVFLLSSKFQCSSMLHWHTYRQQAKACLLNYNPLPSMSP